MWPFRGSQGPTIPGRKVIHMMDTFQVELLAIVASLIALACAGIYVHLVLRMPQGTKKMKSISNAVKEGAMAYLKQQYKWVAVIATIIAILLAVSLGMDDLKGPKIALGFVVGCACSAAAGRLLLSEDC